MSRLRTLASNVFATIFAVAASFLAIAAVSGSARATVDRCLAFAEGGPRLHRVALKPNEVRITFLEHSSFRIESPKGVRIETDYAKEGQDAEGEPVPHIVTMNIAHESHWSSSPDKRIKHVLQGWNPLGGRVRHDLTFEDVRVRNVPTNLRGGNGTTAFSQNSIFIFELGGLCIAHLGHLHHTLTPGHLAQIGQMDIVMVPVDGSFTLDMAGMMETLKQLQPRLILPMHYFGEATLARFTDAASKMFQVTRSDKSSIVVSAASLPKETEVRVLPPAAFANFPSFGR